MPIRPTPRKATPTRSGSLTRNVVIRSSSWLGLVVPAMGGLDAVRARRASAGSHRPARERSGRRSARPTGRVSRGGRRSTPIRPSASSMPIRTSRRGWSSPRISATSPPRPPKTECSSTLTTRSTSRAAAAIAVAIDRLQRRDVEDASGDVVGRQEICRGEAAGRLGPRRHDEDVSAIAEPDDPAGLEARTPRRPRSARRRARCGDRPAHPWRSPSGPSRRTRSHPPARGPSSRASPA